MLRRFRSRIKSFCVGCEIVKLLPMQQKAKKAAGRPKAGREGKRAIAGYFDPTVWLQLKQIGLEQNGKSIQDLLSEALNLLFVKYKKSPLA